MAAKQQVTIELVDKISAGLGKVEDRLKKLERSTNKTQGAFRGAGTALKGFIGLLAVREIVQFGDRILAASDQVLNMTNQLKLVTSSQEELDATFKKLQQTAIETRSSLAGTVDLYSKLTLATEALDISQEQVISVTSKFSKALAISGADAGTAAGAIRQFGQAMASGTVRGDEFNSIVEALGPALAIMARESGLTVGELRKMSQAGKLTAEAFFKMVEGSKAIDQAFGLTRATTEQLEQQLSDTFTLFLADLDKAIGFTEKYQGALKSLIDTLNDLRGATPSLEEILATEPTAEGLRLIDRQLNELLTAQKYSGGGAVKIIQEEIDKLNELTAEYRAAVEAQQAKIEQDLKEDEAIKKKNEALNQVLKPFKKFIDQAREFANTDYRSELEKANQRIIDAEIVLEQLRLAHEVTNGQVENFIELLRGAQNELDAATSAYDKLKESLKEPLEGFAKFYDELITKTTQVVAETGYNVQAQAKLKQQLDSGAITLAVYNEAMEELTGANEKAKTATDKLTSSVQSLQSNYASFYKDQELLLRNAAGEDLVIAQEALDKKILSEQEFADLKYAINEKLSKDLEALEKDRLTKLDAARMRSIEKQIEMNSKNYEFQLDTLDKEYLQAQGNAERQKQITQTRIDFEKKSTAEQYAFGIQQGADFFNALGKYNKKAFEAAKVFNIANAIMNTYLGATKALASYPPPFNFIAAAAVVASGLAQVAAIRSQQFQGRQRGGALNLNEPTVVGEDGPELIVPKQPGTVIPREVADAINGMGGNGDGVTVNFNITTVDAQGFDDLLIQRRATITGIINNALQKKGKQGVV